MRHRRDGSDWLGTTLYVGPSLLALAVIAVAPIGFAIYSSFFDWHFHRSDQREWVGLGNYLELFGDGRFLNSLSITLLYTLLSVGATMVLGFGLALLLKKAFPGRNAVRALLTIPMIMTPVVSTLVWKTFFFESDLGLINWLLALVGVSGPAWIASTPYAFLTVLIVNIWFMTPFVFLIMDAALAGFPEEVLDAAKIDGAGYGQRIFYVVLPMLRATIVFTLVFRITIDYRMFDIIQVMTGGGPAFDTEVLSLWVYRTALRNFHLGYGNAGAVVMMLLVGGVCLALVIWGLRGVTQRLGAR